MEHMKIAIMILIAFIPYKCTVIQVFSDGIITQLGVLISNHIFSLDSISIEYFEWHQVYP